MKSIDSPIVALKCNGDFKEKAIMSQYTYLATFDKSKNVTMILVKVESAQSGVQQQRICKAILQDYKRFGIIPVKVSYHISGASIYQVQPN